MYCNEIFDKNRSDTFLPCRKPISSVFNIRTSTEDTLDKACFILSGIGTNSLLQSVDLVVEMTKDINHDIPLSNCTDDVSNKGVKIIQSNVGVVNRIVWRKL